MPHAVTVSHGAFHAAPDKCIACGNCVKDCPVHIIDLDTGVAAVPEDKMPECLGCQHCLAICPTSAVAVDGKQPEDSYPIGLPSPKAIDLLMRSRRSIRQFDPEPVDRELFDKVLTTAAHAPTGVNIRHRHFTVVLDPKVMHELRDRFCQTVVDNAGKVPADQEWLVSAAAGWFEKKRDVLFRGAPHIMVATCSPGAATPVADCIIALSYFELAAQTYGLATVWCGLVEWLLQFVPETRALFGIPEDHTIGYAMLFGRPGIQYQRTAQHTAENVVVLDRLP